MFSVVAAPAMSTDVALLSNTVAVAALVVMSPPLTARSPVSVVLPVTASVEPTVAAPLIAVVALRIVAVPVVAPIDTVVAA